MLCIFKLALFSIVGKLDSVPGACIYKKEWVFVRQLSGLTKKLFSLMLSSG